MIAPDELENVRVLMVGAGGIGCELLKNLVLTGFKHIEIVIFIVFKKIGIEIFLFEY